MVSLESDQPLQLVTLYQLDCDSFRLLDVSVQAEQLRADTGHTPGRQAA